MTPKVAFMTLFLFDTVRISINFLPELFISTATALVSLRRLMKFLNHEERPMERVGGDDLSDLSVGGEEVVGEYFGGKFGFVKIKLFRGNFEFRNL
jgi:hypothetical protein